jgi:type III pantothenate kinase
VLLVIDVGNTETVIGLYSRDEADPAPEPEESVGVGIGTETDPTAPRGLTHHWRLSTVTTRTPDEHAVLLTQLLDLEGLDIAASVTGIAVSSSVPHVTGELRQMAQRWFSQVPCVVLGPGTKSGMPILYDNPKEVGADRIANAVGAYDLYGGPCVVIDMGTATTVWPSASRRSTCMPPRCAGSSWSSLGT